MSTGGFSTVLGIGIFWLGVVFGYALCALMASSQRADESDGHVRVGREWMTGEEYRRRYLSGVAEAVAPDYEMAYEKAVDDLLEEAEIEADRAAIIDDEAQAKA